MADKITAIGPASYKTIQAACHHRLGIFLGISEHGEGVFLGESHHIIRCKFCSLEEDLPKTWYGYANFHLNAWRQIGHGFRYSPTT